GRIRRIISRPDKEIIKELKQFSTSLVSDSMNRMGAVGGGIHEMFPNPGFCGPAVTVEEVEGGNLMSHAALEYVQPGDVLVIDAKGVTTRSCFGGLQLLMAKKKGVAGVVIYGTVRDYDEMTKYKVPVFSLGVSPGGPLKGWSGNVNYPISCGGAVANPGDIVMGDRDGIVVIPKAIAADVIPVCRERTQMEKEWFNRVEKGETTLDVVGLREKLKQYNVIYE
ncbi:RraA family protein, partial [Fibrobacterota bacterium]